MQLTIQLPPERGHYHVYVSPVTPKDGWFYARNEPFVLIDAFVEHGEPSCHRGGQHHPEHASPPQAVEQHPQGIHPSVYVDLAESQPDPLDVPPGCDGPLSRQLWRCLVDDPEPAAADGDVLLRLRHRPAIAIRADQSRTGFAFYFLAGMLPWLAFSEAIGRAPGGILENRVLVKKVVFPVEILPVTHVISGLVTQAFAAAIFILALLVFRGSVPATIAWLPALLIPQLLFTLGLAWFLSATGVYLRDLRPDDRICS